MHVLDIILYADMVYGIGILLYGNTVLKSS